MQQSLDPLRKRLTPHAIMFLAGEDTALARQLLKEHGYLGSLRQFPRQARVVHQFSHLTDGQLEHAMKSLIRQEHGKPRLTGSALDAARADIKANLQWDTAAIENLTEHAASYRLRITNTGKEMMVGGHLYPVLMKAWGELENFDSFVGCVKFC